MVRTGAKKKAKQSTARKKSAVKAAPAKKKSKAKNKLLYIPGPDTGESESGEEHVPQIAWTCFGRFPSRAATSPLRIEPPLRLAWRTRLASGRTPPVVSKDGVVYVGDADGGLHGLDAETGKRTTELRTDPVGEGSPVWPLVLEGHVPAARVPVSSAPVVAGWLLLYGDDEGIFYCVRRGDSKVLWRKAATLSLAARSTRAYQAPMADDGIVYTVDAEGNLYAADARSGATLFQRYLRGRPATAPALARRRIVIATHPIYGGESPQLHAIETGHGARSWRRDLPGYPREGLAANRELCVAGGDFGLMAFDIETGESRWRRSGSAPVSGSICLDGPTTWAAVGDTMVAIDLDTGSVCWSDRVQGNQPVTGVSHSGGVLWAAAGRSLLAWEAESGELIGRVKVPGTAVGPPVLAMGRVLLATTAGEVVAFEP